MISLPGLGCSAGEVTAYPLTIVGEPMMRRMMTAPVPQIAMTVAMLTIFSMFQISGISAL